MTFPVFPTSPDKWSPWLLSINDILLQVAVAWRQVRQCLDDTLSEIRHLQYQHYHLSAGHKWSTSSSNRSRCACASCCLTARRYRSDSLCLLSSTAICSQHSSQHYINLSDVMMLAWYQEQIPDCKNYHSSNLQTFSVYIRQTTR